MFRGKPIEGVIDHETRTVSFPITTIYASEYPEELLGAVPLDITLSDGYRPTSEKVSYDLSTGESFSVYKGRNTYTYRLVADIAPIPVADHLSDFRFRRGVNLAYWMTEADRDWLGYVMPAQFPLWKELGFDHFRVPVDELCIFDPAVSLVLSCGLPNAALASVATATYLRLPSTARMLHTSMRAIKV